MDEKLIITIKEFRSLTGDATAQFSDDEVAEIIKQLDFLAQMHIERLRSGKEIADKLDNQE